MPEEASARKDSAPYPFSSPAGDGLSRLLYDACPDAVIVIDAQGTILFANPGVETVFGHAPERLVGDNLTVLQPESLRQAHLEGLRRYVATRQRKLDWRAASAIGLHRDGHEFPVEIAFTELGDGRFGGFIRDISERRRADEALRESDERYRDLIENANDIVYSHDLEGNFTSVNRAAMRVFGYSHEEVMHLNIRAIVDPEWVDIAVQAIANKIRGVEHTDPYELLTRDRQGRRVWVEVSTRIIRHDGGPVGVQGIARDITARKRAEEAVARSHCELAESTDRLEEKSRLLERALDTERERARRDPLTSALNHVAIADEVQRLIQDPATSSLGLAMVDVDGLKAVNDTWGHQMGDAVLLAVAEALRHCGAIVGRYGGDEFVAILPGADLAAAAQYRRAVDDALAAIDLRDSDNGSRIQIVASMGLAIYPEEAQSVDDLIKLSDSAMYAARRRRTNVTGSTAFARIRGGDRAAEIVGEIVPFLTSPGDLTEKLNLVGARLSAGAGYDAVNLAVYPASRAKSRTASFAEVSGADALEYDAESQPEEKAGSTRSVLEATLRPIIIDRIAESPFATPEQKESLARVGLRSGLIAPMIWRGSVVGAISVGSKQEAAFNPRDAQFLTAIATQVTAIVRTAALVDDLQAASGRLREAHEGTVLMLASAAEAHDHTTGRHLQRVRTISEALGRELGYSDDDAQALGMAAILHDIGKIRVPDSVLGSSKSLAEAEWVLMKQHCLWGAAFLSGQPGFELASEVARHHHERWDGGGYPDGLVGDAIPEAALITTVADSFDAMTNDRPYRVGRPVADAVAEIVSCSGTQFSPRIVDALVNLYSRGDLAFVHADDEGEDELAA